jgi:hypothetical protein
MSPQAHLALLKEKHASLDRLIWDEQQRVWPDAAELKRMKLEKLRIKEEIDRLTATPPGAPA